MGLLDAWSRRAIERREGRVDFLGDDTGQVEETLKRELILEFSTRPDIRRAYLAKVAFQPQAERALALCIVSTRPDDRSLIMRVGDIVRRRPGAEIPMDILFITPEQEADLAHVCSPFYSAGA